MQLKMEDGTILENPDARDLQIALNRLGSKGNSFAILAQSEMTYLQTSGDDLDGYILEYQVNSLEEHYQSTSAALSKEDVIDAFTTYLEGSYRWREKYQWEKLALGSGGCLLTLLATIASGGWLFRLQH